MDLISALRQHEIIISRSDTVYGIGCAMSALAAKERIYLLKKRPITMPLPLICADVDMIDNIAHLSVADKKTIKHFSPGQVTFIVRSKINSLPETIAVRIPKHRVLLKVISELNEPLWFTSANIHGEPTPNNITHLRKTFGNEVAYYQRGQGGSEVASTIVDLVENKILRSGVVSGEEVLNYKENL